MDRSKWRKLINDVRWSGWVWVGECFFWYRLTWVVPDKRPLNGCVCLCVCVCLHPVALTISWYLCRCLLASFGVFTCWLMVAFEHLCCVRSQRWHLIAWQPTTMTMINVHCSLKTTAVAKNFGYVFFCCCRVTNIQIFAAHWESWSWASHPGFGLSILALPHLITKAQLLQRDSAMDSVSST